jgi:hypothetical protein
MKISKNIKSVPYFWATFSTKKLCTNLYKNVLGHILGPSLLEKNRFLPTEWPLRNMHTCIYICTVKKLGMLVLAAWSIGLGREIESCRGIGW